MSGELELNPQVIVNIKEALKAAAAFLEKSEIEGPAAEAAVILCHVLKCSRAYLFAHASDCPDRLDMERFAGLLKLRAGGMPVQYLTGHQEFMSLDFQVNEAVLIPRHDTEILVETVIAESGKMAGIAGRPLRILDIGTGSGCIAVSLAHFIPESLVTAVDISSEALAVARVNAERNKVADRLEFIQSDLFEGIPDKKFDIIVSNPPYIVRGDLPGLQREVAGFEPLCALDGGEDGLDFYRRITAGAPARLENGGILAFEAGFGQAAEITSLMKKDFNGLSVFKDLAGIDRVVAGKYNEFG